MPSSSTKLKRKGSCFLCGKHNVPLCIHCGFVHSCKLHFLLHYQNDYCFPFKVTSSQGFTASRDIQPLELIWFERPLAFGPKLFDSTKLCSDCLKPNPCQFCSLCDLPICNEACQMGYNHYIECQILRNGRNFFKNQLEIKQKSILPIRILSSQDVSETAFNRAKMLHENIETLEGDDKVIELIKSLTNAEEQEIRWAIALGRRKCVNSSDGQGSVFHPLFSLVRHSCSANAKYLVYANHCIAMQAQNHISAGDEIRVSYVPTLEPTWKRRAMLYRNRLESCLCNRCQDPTEFGTFLSALQCCKCPNDNQSPLLPHDPTDPDSSWTCSVHRRVQIPAKAAQQLAIDLQMDLYAGGLITTIKSLQEKIQTLQGFLHPNHGLILAAQRSLVNCYSQVSSDEQTSNRKHQEKMKKICQGQLQILDKIDQGFADWKGDLLKHLSTALLNLARMDLQEGLISRPQFLNEVKEAMKLVQEGIRCKSCVKMSRSTMTLEEMVDSMSDSDSRKSSRANSLLDLR